MAKEDDNSKYKGPGKFNSTLGRLITEGFIVGVIGSVIGLGIGALTKKKVSVHELEEMENGVRSFLKDVPNTITGAALGGAIGQFGGAIHGGYKGYTNAKAAETQVDELNQELTVAKNEAAQQKQFVAALTQERQKEPETARQK